MPARVTGRVPVHGRLGTLGVLQRMDENVRNIRDAHAFCRLKKVSKHDQSEY